MFPEIVKFDADLTQQISLWGSSKGKEFPLSGLFVKFDSQVSSLLENALSDEHVGLRVHWKLISPTLGQCQALFSPFTVIKSIFES